MFFPRIFGIYRGAFFLGYLVWSAFIPRILSMGCFFLGYLVGVPFFLGYLVWGACFPRIFGMGCLFS